MCRLKYFVTVCGTVLSHIMKGPCVRVFKGNLQTNAEPKRMPDPPWRCHNTRLPGPPSCWTCGDPAVAFQPHVRRTDRGFALGAADTSAAPLAPAHALQSWNLKGKFCTLIKKKKKVHPPLPQFSQLFHHWE